MGEKWLILALSDAHEKVKELPHWLRDDLLFSRAGVEESVDAKEDSVPARTPGPSADLKR